MITKTLADFKRDITPGLKIEYIALVEDTGPGTELIPKQIPEKIAGVRTVTYKDTTGFYLNATPEDGKRGSFCEFCKAGDLRYDGAIFEITARRRDGSIWQRRTYKII